MNITLRLILGFMIAMPWAIEPAAPARAAAAAPQALIDMGTAEMEDAALNAFHVVHLAVKKNDIRCIKRNVRELTPYQLAVLRRDGNALDNPQAFFALFPRVAHEAPRKALDDHFFYIQDAYPLEAKRYQQALARLHQKEAKRVQGIMETVAQNTPLTPDLALLVAHMMHPTIKKSGQQMVEQMHPELESAIATGDLNHFTQLRDAGWLTDAKNNQGLDALTLAVNKGQLDIVRNMVEHISFVDKEQQERLEKIAKDEAERYKRMIDLQEKNSVNKEKHQKYQAIADIIATAWPHKTKDSQLSQAFLRNTGAFAKALATGANPNLIDRSEPIAIRAISEDDLPNETVFLKMLVDTKKIDVNGLFKDKSGIFHRLVQIAIGREKRLHLEVLLEAGADPNGVDFVLGQPMACFALRLNPAFLGTLIASKKFNPNVLITTAPGITCPLSAVAIQQNAWPYHISQLLSVGANPNALDSTGKPVAWHALHNDNTHFLEELLDTNKLDINATIHHEGAHRTLLGWAIVLKKTKHAALLRAKAMLCPTVQQFINADRPPAAAAAAHDAGQDASEPDELRSGRKRKEPTASQATQGPAQSGDYPNKRKQ